MKMNLKRKKVTLAEVSNTVYSFGTWILMAILGPFIGALIYEEFTGNTIIFQEMMAFLDKAAEIQAYDDAVRFVVGMFLFGLALWGVAALLWLIDNRKKILTREFWAPVNAKKEASK